jgi:transcription elongation factor GreA
MNRPPVTAKGSDRLKAELLRLKGIDRPRIVQDIATAREHGDLKENAEYHAAREQQGFCEGRIQELEASLSMAQVIDVESLDVGDRVVFGATVTLEDVDTEEEVIYQIVGDIEAYIKENLIAVSSPIARAFIGKEAGYIAVVIAPNGNREYEITGVEYK